MRALKVPQAAEALKPGYGEPAQEQASDGSCPPGCDLPEGVRRVVAMTVLQAGTLGITHRKRSWRQWSSNSLTR
jgi:hypothetical protein